MKLLILVVLLLPQVLWASPEDYCITGDGIMPYPCPTPTKESLITLSGGNYMVGAHLTLNSCESIECPACLLIYNADGKLVFKLEPNQFEGAVSDALKKICAGVK